MVAGPRGGTIGGAADGADWTGKGGPDDTRWVPPVHAAFTTRVLAVLLLVAAGGGCDNQNKLQSPATLKSPLPRESVWAVAPFLNESGVSTADGARVADQMAKVVEEADGLSCVAVNRTLAAMQSLRLPAVTSDQDAARLCAALGVDGLLIGTITLWDPYPPPKEGLAVQLYLREKGAAPVAQASGIFDSSNHAVLADLKAYAASRYQPGAPYGADIYQVEMSRYSEFAAHQVLAQLLAKLGPPPER